MKRIITLLVFSVLLPISSFGQWSSDVLISSDTSAGLTENMGRCLAVSGDSVHVVWMDRKLDSTAIYYKHSYDGGLTWSEQIALTQYSKSVDMPSIAASGPLLYVVYRDNSGAQPQSMYVRSIDAGKTWITGGSQGTYYFWPNIISRGSDVYVGYNDSQPGNSEVYLSRSNDDGITWSPRMQISNASGRSEDQTIAGASGSVYVGWNDNRTGLMQSWYRFSNDNGMTWSDETQLTSSTGGTYFPYLEAADSNVEYVGGDKTSGNFEILYKHSSDHGLSWTAAKQLTHSAGKLAAYPVISRDHKDLNLVYFVFGGDLIYLHSRNNFDTWDSTVLVTADKSPGQSFVVASTNATHVIWVDKRTGHPQVYYKRLPIPMAGSKLVVPKTVVFGAFKVSQQKDTTIWLKNIGSEDINVLRYIVTDATHAFTVIDTSRHRILPSDSIPITLAFDAYNMIGYRASLTILTDERTAENPHSISLSANVYTGQIVSTSPIVFDTTLVGQTRDTTIKIWNIGDAATHIRGYSLADFGGGFAFVDTTVHDVSVADTAHIVVRFAPKSASEYIAVLTVATDEAGSGKHTISLIGNGEANSGSGILLEDESATSVRFSALPNPSNGMLALRIAASAEVSNAMLNVFDERGALVTHQALGRIESGDNIIPLTLPKVSGQYLLQLNQDGATLASARVTVVR